MSEGDIIPWAKFLDQIQRGKGGKEMSNGIHLILICDCVHHRTCGLTLVPPYPLATMDNKLSPHKPSFYLVSVKYFVLSVRKYPISHLTTEKNFTQCNVNLLVCEITLCTNKMLVLR